MEIEDMEIDELEEMSNYHNERHEYELMKKYLLQGVEKGCGNCMNGLANYYIDIEKDISKGLEYFEKGR
jgi:hypothetical protein